MKQFLLCLVVVATLALAVVARYQADRPVAINPGLYEREGYEDALNEIPVELCPYHDGPYYAAKQWYLRGYKRGYIEWRKRQ